MSRKNEGERTAPTDEVVAAAERELGTEDVSRERKRKHEVRPDGSIAYFTELEETAAERELAEAGIPAREVGTPKEDSK